MTDTKKKPVSTPPISRDHFRDDFYLRCSIHGIAYPKGSKCPACASGESKQKTNQEGRKR